MTVKNYLDIHIRRDCSFDDIKKLITALTKIARTQNWGITLKFTNHYDTATSWQPKVEDKGK